MRLGGGFLAWLLVVFCLVAAAATQGSLSFRDRSRRQVGCANCILLTECPALIRLLATRTRAAIFHVQRAICGYQGQQSKVCCPSSETITEPTSRPRLPRKPKLPTSCGFSNEFNRIFGGKEAALGAYPWVAALGYLRPGNTELQFHCSGSLITERYILTAAHCLDPATLRGRRLVEIRLGEWDLIRDTDCQIGEEGENCAPPYMRVLMEDAVIHPTYARRYQYSDDIGLIRLTANLDLEELSPNISPVCLPPTFAPGLTAVGEEVLAVGWGMTEAGRLSDTLQQVNLPIVEPERCRDVYGPAFGDKQICAGGIEGEDTCSGDSGGPLLKRGPPYQQVGIVSFGLAVCGTNNTPAVYTSVSDYRQWIVDNIEA